MNKGEKKNPADFRLRFNGLKAASREGRRPKGMRDTSENLVASWREIHYDDTSVAISDYPAVELADIAAASLSIRKRW